MSLTTPLPIALASATQAWIEHCNGDDDVAGESSSAPAPVAHTPPLTRPPIPPPLPLAGHQLKVFFFTAVILKITDVTMVFTTLIALQSEAMWNLCRRGLKGLLFVPHLLLCGSCNDDGGFNLKDDASGMEGVFFSLYKWIWEKSPGLAFHFFDEKKGKYPWVKPKIKAAATNLASKCCPCVGGSGSKKDTSKDFLKEPLTADVNAGAAE